MFSRPLDRGIFPLVSTKLQGWHPMSDDNTQSRAPMITLRIALAPSA
jgi:hypothetical protein